MGGLIVSSVFLGIVIIVAIIISISEYYMAGYNDLGPAIKFATFKTFYDINPERWELDSGDVTYKIPRKHMEDCTRRVYLHFDLIGYYQYKYWLKNQSRGKRTREHDKELYMVIESVKKDIKEYEKRHKTEMDETLKDIWNTSKKGNVNEEM